MSGKRHESQWTDQFHYADYERPRLCAYVIVAIWGAYMAIVPVTNLGLAVTGTMAFGMITSFLTLTGNFINPIS